MAQIWTQRNLLTCWRRGMNTDPTEVAHFLAVHDAKQNEQGLCSVKMDPTEFTNLLEGGWAKGIFVFFFFAFVAYLFILFFLFSVFLLFFCLSFLLPFLALVLCTFHLSTTSLLFFTHTLSSLPACSTCISAHMHYLASPPCTRLVYLLASCCCVFCRDWLCPSRHEKTEGGIVVADCCTRLWVEGCGRMKG